MWTLGLETSGLIGAVALACDDVVVAERTLDTAGRRHAQTLLTEVDALLRSAALKPSDIDTVAVSLGPGSFTGLRVGVVCAKTWCYATGCHVVGIETFATVASQAPTDCECVWVISDAQRGDFFAAEYRRDGDEWSCVTPVAIVEGTAWLGERTAKERLIGPGVTRVSEAQTTAMVIRDSWSMRPSAAALALLGAKRVRGDQVDDVWKLAPIYIRPSAAEEKRSAV
jgi:tRNA threonylcarbamoyladenosine biosynthesis protein TsaB